MELAKQGLKTRMILQVHDEIVLEAPLEEVEHVKPLIKQLMESAAIDGKFTVPLTVDVEISDQWLTEE